MTRTLPTDLSSDVAARLRHCVFRLRRVLHRQVQGDLTPSQASALASVERLGPLTLGELSAVESVRPPTMTKVVAALEDQGLVARLIDPNDRRVCRVEATPQGSALLATSRLRTDAYLEARLRSLSPTERAALERAIEVLERLAEGDE
ncbi:MAG: MarR family transcriptional regulator [Actinomycetota bacterium]